MTVLIIIGCIIAYLTTGGYSYAAIQSRLKPKCTSRYSCGDHGHDIVAGLSVIAWPAVLPICLGVMMGNRSPVDRAQRKRAREIENAKHKAELARIKRLEEEEISRRIEAMK